MDTLLLIKSRDVFEKALKEVIHSYYSSNHSTEDSDINAAKTDLKTLLFDSNFDTNNVPKLLIDKGWDEERIAFLVDLLNEKKTELLYASLLHQNSEYGEIVTNFDWVLKLVIGTSELNSLKYPLLQLILSTDNNGTHKKILYDINKEMLLKMIDTLEKL